ncbi:pantoate--beta-alanine ligase [Candidatus Latescibacterota bacterium]
MKVISDITEIRRICEEKRLESKRIGFVPTMGAFHEGHLSLIRRARKKTDVIVVSIYVNPIQFGKNEDLNKYPRNIDADIRLAEVNGADIVFVPGDEIMYPEGYSTYITVERLTDMLCGRSRPEHFRGVTTVVVKLFNIIRPHVVVFGQKDAQQLSIIRKMVSDLNMDIEIDAGPIIREPDGLAMSSRNQYLSKEEREQAPVLYKSLQAAQELFESGTTSAPEIVDKIKSILDKVFLVKTEYIEIVDIDNLSPVDDVSDCALIAIAARIGETRLIDNIIIEK